MPIGTLITIGFAYFVVFIVGTFSSKRWSDAFKPNIESYNWGTTHFALNGVSEFSGALSRVYKMMFPYSEFWFYLIMSLLGMFMFCTLLFRSLSTIFLLHLINSFPSFELSQWLLLLPSENKLSSVLILVLLYYFLCHPSISCSWCNNCGITITKVNTWGERQHTIFQWHRG